MINIVTALHCEASPIIQHFRLKKLKQDHAFSIYDNGRIALIVSGIGKTLAATAVGYLQALLQNQTPNAWFNVGIAGHKQLALGTGFLAHRITDMATAKRYYPSFAFTPPCITDEVVSVDTVETDYSENVGYDMEASGFFSAAMRFSTSELVHSFKIVSDNKHQSPEYINKHVGQELVAHHLLLIEALVTDFETLKNTVAAIYAPPNAYEQIQQQFNFSVTQDKKLKGLLQRCQVLGYDDLFNNVNFNACRNAKQALAAVESYLITRTVG